MSKKKTKLHESSIFIPYGYEYLEDLPEFHIEGKECTEIEYRENLEAAIKSARTFIHSKVLGKRLKNDYKLPKSP